MGVIYLLRHAQAPAAAYGGRVREAPADGKLTALGTEQARRAGVALAARTDRLDHLVSGDLPRQRQTLTLCVQFRRMQATPVVDTRWNEYDIDAVLGGGGQAATMTGAQLQAVLDEALTDWVGGQDSHDHGLETYASYQRRCRDALDAARGLASSGKTVLVVSSSGTITQVLAQLWGLDGPQWIRMARTMINASLTKLIVGRGGVSVVSVNEHAHVEDASATGQRTWMTFR
jgi:broad specificity phosphatase PhoE